MTPLEKALVDAWWAAEKQHHGTSLPGNMKTALTAAGFAVVPVEPTKEQLDTSWLAPEQTRALWQTLIRAAG